MSGAAEGPALDKALFEFLLRTGDNTLILGHRVSEWCGHAPVLEEDIALANVALDLIGQTRLWLDACGERGGRGSQRRHSSPICATPASFATCCSSSGPNGHFGMTLMRQFLFDAWHIELLEGLVRSTDARIAEIAAKAIKEVAYHLERSSELVIGLGDGSEESHARMQAALEELWPYTGELFLTDDTDRALAEAGVAPPPDSLKPKWEATVHSVAAGGDAEAAGERLRAQGRQARRPYRASRLTFWPTCSSCSAPIPARTGEDDAHGVCGASDDRRCVAAALRDPGSGDSA